jgi:hypothetical protein
MEPRDSDGEDFLDGDGSMDGGDATDVTDIDEDENLLGRGGASNDEEGNDDEDVGFAQAAPDVLREDVEAIILDLKDVIMRHKRANNEISKMLEVERKAKDMEAQKYKELTRQCVLMHSESAPLTAKEAQVNSAARRGRRFRGRGRRLSPPCPCR